MTSFTRVVIYFVVFHMMRLIVSSVFMVIVTVGTLKVSAIMAFFMSS